ncbi:hypothetical protein L7F22_019176 [Adiantum nelumboides]|nr:hypothetical protein [Adiantum nelumboides]
MSNVGGYEMNKGDQSNTASSSKTIDFSTSLATWREIALPTIQANLEQLCPTLIESQKDALLSRKKLAEQTREFKKLTSESQPEAIKPLLKAYQSEIDSLTKRAKAAENAVLSVKDRLQGASDPYPILELVLEQTAVMGDIDALKEQLKGLQSTNASLESQIASIPSLEAEKNRLTNRVTQLESTTSESRKNVEAELSAKWDERIRNHKAREENLSKSVETLRSQLKELRANYSKVTERLLHHGEEIEREQTNGKIEEMEMISEELTRSNERAAAMERRNEQLREEIERLKSGSGADEQIAELEQRAFDAEEETRRLSKLLDDEHKKTTELDLTKDTKVRDLQSQVRERDREIEVLRERLHKMSDYDEIKREIEIFKYVEFSDQQLEGDEANGHANGSSSAKPLEALLMEKNRQLQDEVTNIRVTNTELTNTSNQLKQDLEIAQKESNRLKKLNERLEDDLMNVNSTQPSTRSVKEKINSNMSAEEALAEMDKIGKDASVPKGSKAESQITGSNQAVTADVTPADSTNITRSTTPSQSNTAAGSTSSSSILPIITSQRDRFRARNAELEEELRKQFATITELRNEVKVLQSDNLALYEKVRYLQAYHASSSLGNANGSSSAAANPSRMVNMVSARNDYGGSGHAYPPTIGEDKYREKYEASMNPFEQFRGREQSRALSSLNPLERLLHMVTRQVLGHRRMRIFFVAYALCLHLLVFAMIFEVEFGTGSNIPIDTRGTSPANR